MLSGAALEAAVRQLPSRPRHGTFLRAVPLEHQRTPLLGEACAAARCIDGLAFASAARPGGQALAVFVDSLATLGSSLTVHRPSGRVWQRLP
jgi:hypothetical protein